MRGAYVLSSVLLLGLLTQFVISVNAQSEEGDIDIICWDSWDEDGGTTPIDVTPGASEPGIGVCQIHNPTDQQQSGIILYHPISSAVNPVTVLSAPVSFDLAGGEQVRFNFSLTAPEGSNQSNWFYSALAEVTHIEGSECSDCATDWWTFKVSIKPYAGFEISMEETMLTMRAGEELLVAARITNTANSVRAYTLQTRLIGGGDDDHGDPNHYIFRTYFSVLPDHAPAILISEDVVGGVSPNETIVVHFYIKANKKACDEEYTLPWESLEESFYLSAQSNFLQNNGAEVVASIDCSLGPFEEEDEEEDEGGDEALPAPTVVISILTILIATLGRSRRTL